jgi:hypothetical protein
MPMVAPVGAFAYPSEYFVASLDHVRASLMSWQSGDANAKPLTALEWIFMFLESPPQSGEQDTLWQKIVSIAIYLFFWILFSAIGLWLMFELREVGVELMILAQFNPWAVRGFDRLAIYLLGLAWFVGLMWIDHYLRTGIGKKRLWRNIAKVASIEAILAATALGVRFILTMF